MRRGAWLVCLAFPVLVIACGDDDGDSSGDGTAETAGSGGVGQGGSLAKGGTAGQAGGRPGSQAGESMGGHSGEGGSPDSGGTSAGGADGGGGASSGAGAGGASNEGGAPSACEFAPCGGDPVGTWEAEELCVEPVVSLPLSGTESCDVVVENQDVSLTGTMTFEEDGTYSSEGQYEFSFDVSVPFDCLGPLAQRPETACALLPALVVAQGGSANCVARDEVCACNVNLSQSMPQSGTYAVDGDRLTLDGSTELAFCVSDDALVLAGPGTTGTAVYRRVR